ncbi:MAG: WYL domain-containing transcriptional regulator [Clostridiales bacterium]|nr:WYL domain-containing transcriptional regulator [Clostridiales bacterium]
MAYSELIKDFARIRDYMREFYVYGFKSRDEYDAKSARSYDNERRRIESWLGDYMAFRQDAAGKNVFLSVDSRQIPHNPLHKAFKAKSFTNKDITLHFYLLDILADGRALTCREIVDRINDEYLSRFSGTFSLDESTVRKKLKEYEGLGLLRAEKNRREVFYQRTDGVPFPLSSWADALAFYSEEDPMGAVGSFLLDKLEEGPDVFRFKHHYILHALDSDILCQLLQAIDGRQSVELTAQNLRNGNQYRRTVCPLKIYVSTQSGRQYLLGYHYRGGRMAFFRLDAIKKVAIGGEEKQYDVYLERQAEFDRHLWGVSPGVGHSLDHIEMTVRFGPGEDFIVQRLEREKRHGTVEVLDGRTCRFSADVYDASELLPWLRTFIGRIMELKCSNQAVTNTFYEDLRRMSALYGGGGDAVP